MVAPSSTKRPALREARTKGWWETMRCNSDQSRLTSEQRRLSTHLPLFAMRSAERFARAVCGSCPTVLSSTSLSISWLRDFTGIVLWLAELMGLLAGNLRCLCHPCLKETLELAKDTMRLLRRPRWGNPDSLGAIDFFNEFAEYPRNRWPCWSERQRQALSD